MTENFLKAVVDKLFAYRPECKTFETFMEEHTALAQIIAMDLDGKDRDGKSLNWIRAETVIVALWQAERAKLFGILAPRREAK